MASPSCGYVPAFWAIRSRMLPFSGILRLSESAPPSMPNSVPITAAQRGSGANLARSRHLLRPVLHSPGIATGHSRRFDRHPTSEWMVQMARNATDESSGGLRGLRYLLHDRDTKFCSVFLDVLRSSGIRLQALPPRSPNLDAFAERWVGSVRQECLSKLILFGETSLRRALTEYIDHHHFEHFERNHQGKRNLLLFPSPDVAPKCRTVHRRDRKGGLLKFYSRVA